MLHAYRWQAIMSRTSVFLVFSLTVILYFILEPFYVRRGKTTQRAGHGGSAVDWVDVFSFIPPGLKSCQDLFKNMDKDEPFDREYVDKRLVFKERIRQTYKRTDKRMGHTGKFTEEALVMHTLVKNPFVRTVCETGFNAGHGAFLWLQSNPNVTVFSFDINEYPYVRPMAKFLQKMFPGRLGVAFGDSRETIPEFHATNPHVTCDLILVDGGHIYDVAKQDYENFRKMASKNSVIIYDNYPQSSMVDELGEIWETAKKKGEIMEVLRCDYEPEKEQGFSVARFNPDSLIEGY